jgi:hypothetical protein
LMCGVHLVRLIPRGELVGWCPCCRCAGCGGAMMRIPIRHDPVLPAFVSFCCYRVRRRRTPIRPYLSLFDIGPGRQDRRGAAQSATTPEANYQHDRAPSSVHHTSAFTNSCRCFLSDSSGILPRALIRARAFGQSEGRPWLDRFDRTHEDRLAFLLPSPILRSKRPTGNDWP